MTLGGLVPPSRPSLADGSGSGHGNQGGEMTVGVRENQRLDLGRAGRQRDGDCRGRGDSQNSMAFLLPGAIQRWESRRLESSAGALEAGTIGLRKRL